jgi:hypothetical protein
MSTMEQQQQQQQQPQVHVPRQELNAVTESLKDILASVVGSAACVYTGQPFDTVKVRMQVQPGEFRNSLECFRKTMVGEGIPTLWRGSVPALIGALSENAVAFFINGNLKRVMQYTRSDQDQPSAAEPFVAGGITGFCTAFALCPSDVLKCRSQLSRAKGLALPLSAIFAQTIKTEGLMGLYRGIGAQVMRDIPFYSSFFGTYELSCRYLRATTTWNDTAVYFVSGGFAGQVGWLMSIAPDTIKSTIQTAEVPLGIVATTRQVVAARGVAGLFNGVDVAIVRAFPANAALFVGYEMSRKLMSF